MVAPQLPLAELLGYAHTLADLADEISLARFGGAFAARAKPDGTPVTEADEAIESTLRARILADHGHAVLGEEAGGGEKADGDIGPAPTWVIDPIDATKNFVRGIPVFATLIALVVGGRPVIGVASAPAMGERWDAAQGLGARRNGSRVHVSAIGALADSHVLHGGLDWYRGGGLWELLGRIADEAWRTRGFGDFWMHLLVAGGMAEVAFERDVKPWDVAALECIVSEAGGRLTSFDGGPALTSGQALSTNGRVHERMVALLRDVV